MMNVKTEESSQSPNTDASQKEFAEAEEPPSLLRVHSRTEHRVESPLQQSFSQKISTQYSLEDTTESSDTQAIQTQSEQDELTTISPLLSESRQHKLKPRHTTHYNSWHYKDMILAIKSVQTKMLSMTAAAKRYNIPRTTLRHYLNDGTNKEAKRVGFFLHKEQEKSLVDYAIRHSHLPEQQLYKFIFEKAKELSQSTTVPSTSLLNTDDGKEERRNIPTPAWIRRFVYRQKQLHSLFPTLLTRIEHPLHGGSKMLKDHRHTDSKRTLYQASAHGIEAGEHLIEASDHVSMVNTTGIYFPTFREQHHPKTRSPTQSYTRISKSSSDNSFTRESITHEHSRQNSSESYTKAPHSLEDSCIRPRENSSDFTYNVATGSPGNSPSLTWSRQSPGSSFNRSGRSPSESYAQFRTTSSESSSIHSPRQPYGDSTRNRYYSLGDSYSNQSVGNASPIFSCEGHSGSKIQSTMHHGNTDKFNSFIDHNATVKIEQTLGEETTSELYQQSTRIRNTDHNSTSPSTILVNKQRVTIPGEYNKTGHTYHENQAQSHDQKHEKSRTQHNNNVNKDSKDELLTLEMRVMTRTLETMELELGSDYVQLFKERYEKNTNLERLYCQWLHLKTNVERLNEKI